MRATNIIGGILCTLLARGCSSHSTSTREFSDEQRNRCQDAGGWNFLEKL